jgi:ribose 5-phosphate isomerase B
MERERIREHVRAVLTGKLAAGQEPQAAPGREAAPADLVSWRRFDDTDRLARKPLVTQADVMRARGAKALHVGPDAIVTPLAAETAGRLGITIERTPQAASAAASAPRDAAATQPSQAARVVAIGADHGGFALKELLLPFVGGLGFAVVDLGTKDTAPVDYPDFAHKVAAEVAARRAAFGIMVDGVGVGSAMAANRHSGIRAAPCSTTLQAHSAREHNDANVLTLGGRHLGEDAAKAIVRTFLETAFAGGRHVPRVEKIDAARSA